MIAGDAHARSSQWWVLDNESAEVCEINTLMTTAGYSQFIDQPTHETKGPSFCIDLIFTTLPSYYSTSM